jgi:putative DNA primase/helicase
MASTASKAAKTKPSSGQGNMHGLVKTVSDAICKSNHFALDAGGKLYCYHKGVYLPNGDTVIKKLVKRFTVETMQDKSWHRSLNADVIEFISIDAPTLWSRPPVDELNVRNGILRLKDRVLLPHSPNHLTASQLPVLFDARAKCEAIDTFVEQVFPSDSVPLAYEIAGWLMLPITSIQKAILLNGGGGNGKSVYLNLLCKLLGASNYSSLALHKLEDNRFAASRLIGKLANICADLPTESLAGTSVFKAITGGDTLTAEYKFQNSFDFQPFARLVFSSNSLPQSNDASQGFFDRWVVVPFDRSFRGTGVEIPRAELDARLTSPGELSGLLNKALDALETVKKRNWRLHSSETLSNAHREFHSITDPLGVWLDQFTVDDPDVVTVKAVLRGAYGAECERKGRPATTAKTFAQALQRHRPKLDTAQRKVNGRVEWCYIGIGFRAEDSQRSQDSQHLPNLLLPTNRELPNESIDVGINRKNPVNPVIPVNDNRDIPRDFEVSPSLDDINAMLNGDANEVVF